MTRMTPRQHLVQILCLFIGTVLFVIPWAAALFFIGLDGSAFLLTEDILLFLMASATLGVWLLSYAIWLDRRSQ